MPGPGIKVINVDEDFKARVKIQASNERRTIKEVIVDAYALYERALKSRESGQIGKVPDRPISTATDRIRPEVRKYLAAIEIALSPTSEEQASISRAALSLLMLLVKHAKPSTVSKDRDERDGITASPGGAPDGAADSPGSSKERKRAAGKA